MHKENRRIFFEDYAQHNKFEPYNPSNWYKQPFYKILAYEVLLNLVYWIQLRLFIKDANQVLSHHKGNIVNALVDLFPNIGLDETKFTLEGSMLRSLETN